MLKEFSAEPSVLCMVVETEGSCPGKTGFRMLVPSAGPPRGSVGGGAMEHEVIRHAGELLQNGSTGAVLREFSHRADAEPGTGSGMICSGRQSIVLVPHPPLTPFPQRPAALRITAPGISFHDEPFAETGLIRENGEWEYIENLLTPPHVYIFGGGHCSLALSPVLKSLGMRVTVVDNRDSIWTMEANTAADERIHLPYTRAGSVVPEGSNSLVVIMTDSHMGDAVVLEQMLVKKLKYIGMMASRTTAAHTLGRMKELGFSSEELARVHSPVGIPIGSHTPAEIAVSIAAEIIAVINGKDGSPRVRQ